MKRAKQALARIGRAMADPTRCRLLVALLDGPAYPSELAAKLGLTRPNVSNHLACLRGCGLAVAAYEGRQARYELADPHLAEALRNLLSVVLAINPETPARTTSSSRSGRRADERRVLRSRRSGPRETPGAASR